MMKILHPEICWNTADSSIMKLNIISGRYRCKILEKLDFKKIHQVGSHVRYIHSDGRKTVIPVHSNEMLGRGLINEILKQAKLSRNDYERLRLKV